MQSILELISEARRALGAGPVVPADAPWKCVPMRDSSPPRALLVGLGVGGADSGIAYPTSRRILPLRQGWNEVGSSNDADLYGGTGNREILRGVIESYQWGIQVAAHQAILVHEYSTNGSFLLTTEEEIAKLRPLIHLLREPAGTHLAPATSPRAQLQEGCVLVTVYGAFAFGWCGEE